MRVYVCGSFKDLEVARSVVEDLRAAGHAASCSLPGDPQGIDGCLRRIDEADIVYVVNPRGEIGKSVSLDLGYALARGRPIVAMLPITDPPIDAHVAGAADAASLIRTMDGGHGAGPGQQPSAPGT